MLVVIGDRDFAGPGDLLADALPDARVVVLRNVDHFATPESFGFIDAVLEFLDADPRMTARAPVTTDVGLAPSTGWSPAGSSPSRPRPCTGSAPTPTTPPPSARSSPSRTGPPATR